MLLLPHFILHFLLFVAPAHAHASNHPWLFTSTDTINFGDAQIGDTLVISFEAISIELGSINVSTHSPFGIRTASSRSTLSHTYPMGTSDTLRAFILATFIPTEELTYQGAIVVRSGDSVRTVVLKGRGRGFAGVAKDYQPTDFSYNDGAIQIEDRRAFSIAFYAVNGQLLRLGTLNNGGMAVGTLRGPILGVIQDARGKPIARIKLVL